jgi:hypothetical protein
LLHVAIDHQAFLLISFHQTILHIACHSNRLVKSVETGSASLSMLVAPHSAEGLSKVVATSGQQAPF